MALLAHGIAELSFVVLLMSSCVTSSVVNVAGASADVTTTATIACRIMSQLRNEDVLWYARKTPHGSDAGAKSSLSKPITGESPADNWSVGATASVKLLANGSTEASPPWGNATYVPGWVIDANGTGESKYLSTRWRGYYYLTVTKFNRADDGDYYCRFGCNSDACESESTSLRFVVPATPSTIVVSYEPNVTYLGGPVTMVNITCQITSYPQAIIRWIAEADGLRSESQATVSVTFNESSALYTVSTSFIVRSFIVISNPMTITCMATYPIAADGGVASQNEFAYPSVQVYFTFPTMFYSDTIGKAIQVVCILIFVTPLVMAAIQIIRVQRITFTREGYETEFGDQLAPAAAAERSVGADARLESAG